jgi:sulfide:quinone oxidoreductase
MKWPVAPLEFTFLTEELFRHRGMRDQVELVYVTLLDGAFTKPIAPRYLDRLLDERKIAVETDFLVERVGASQSSHGFHTVVTGHDPTTSLADPPNSQAHPAHRVE